MNFHKLFSFLFIVFMLIMTSSCDKNITGLNEITSIKIISEPTKVTYLVGEKLSLDGLKVVAIHENEEEIALAEKDLTISGFSSKQESERTVVFVTYKGHTAKFHVKIEGTTESAFTSIRIISEPHTTEYFIGEPLLLEGLRVVGLHDDSSEISIPTDDLTISGFSSDKESESTDVIIDYYGLKSHFTVKVLPYHVDLTTMTLKKYVGDATSVIISDRIKSIGSYAFALGFTNTPITEVIIPEGVTTIEEFAFFQTPIEEITLPKSINKIGVAAFRETSSLKNVEMSECQITHLEEEVFNGSAVENIQLPKTLEVIHAYAFLDASNLSFIRLPENVVVIGNMSFRDSGLKEIEIPNYTYRITENAFAYCEFLESVITYGTRMSDPIQQPAYIGSYAFVDCKKLKRLDIPKSIRRIDGSAAINLPLLSEITLHENIQTIETRAFHNSGLNRVTILTDFPPQVSLRDWESPENNDLFPAGVSEIMVKSTTYNRYKTNYIWKALFDKMKKIS